MSDNFTADAPSVVKPYDFGKATFVPFQHFKFCLKLIISYFLATIILSGIYMFYIYNTGMMLNLSGETPPAGYWIATILFYLVMWPFYASYITAFYKRVTIGYDGGWFPMRFGGRELRVMAVQFVWLITIILFSIVVILVFSLLGVLMVGLSGGGEPNIALLVLFGFFGYFGMIIAYMYFMARIAAASPLTVIRNKFTFLDSFKATRKRGWWMVLSYFVQFLLLMVGYFVLIGIVFALIGGTMFNSQTGQINEDAFASAFTSPVAIIIGILAYLIIILGFSLLSLMFPGVGGYVAKEHEGSTDLEKISALYD